MRIIGGVAGALALTCGLAISSTGRAAAAGTPSAQTVWYLNFDARRPEDRCVKATKNMSGIIDGLIGQDKAARLNLFIRRDGSALVDSEDAMWGSGERMHFVATTSEAWCRRHFDAEAGIQAHLNELSTAVLPPAYTIEQLRSFLAGRTPADVISILGPPDKELVGPYSIRYDGLPVSGALIGPLTGTVVWISFGSKGEVNSVR